MSLVRFRGNRTGPWGYVYTERERQVEKWHC